MLSVMGEMVAIDICHKNYVREQNSVGGILVIGIDVKLKRYLIV